MLKKISKNTKKDEISSKKSMKKNESLLNSFLKNSSQMKPGQRPKTQVLR